MKLETRTTAQLGSVDDEWETDDLEDGEKIDDAVEKARENRDEKYVVNAGSHLWLFTVQWNDNTDSVWVHRFGINGGMEAQENE